MAAIESFEDVRELGEPELRALLDGGRPEERVWAIWALALRSVAHVDELARRQEPDAGVRRNLAVVLAGHGELDLLVALAKRDPAPEVRAAAMQLVTRLATEGMLPPSLVVERATADSAEVRIAVLGTIFTGAPRWLLELAERMLADRDGDVRYEAFEALVRAGETAPALMWLEEAPEAEARLSLMRWSARAPGGGARSGVRACAEVLAQSSRRLRRLLVESVRVATWHDLAPAIGDEPSLIQALARRNPAAFEQIPLAALIRATLRESNDAWILMIRERLAALDSPDDIAPLLHEYIDLCTHRLDELEDRMAELRADRGGHGHDDLEALEAHRIAFESARDQATRLLVH